jgi:AraC-like DNA-binding protein
MGGVLEIGSVDVLSDVLAGMGLQTRLFCHSDLCAPWCLAFPASTLAHFHYIERGGAWVRLGEDPDATSLGPGDLVVLPHGKRYQISDTPDRDPIPFAQVVPHSPRGCSVVRAGGDGPRTSMLCGAFSMKHPSHHPLLTLLPPVLLLRAEESSEAVWVESTLRQLATEAHRQEPGAELVSHRLTDILFVQVLRSWLQRATNLDGTWLGALRDPQVGKALSMLHAKPSHPWTIQELASQVGLSRSPFAARFVRQVGASPMAYLTRLRMKQAADLLRSQPLSLLEAALACGYQSEAAFSKAFRREFGVPPGQYRRAS